jgi:NAD(P)-dependent dehydrogenase (short-subunit alcohol dehydrogenase family)
MNELGGSRIVVVGGSSGIGLAVARQAAARGARVTIAARSRERLARAAAAMPAPVDLVPCDLTDDDSVARAAAAFGAIDHLVIPGSGDAVVAPFASLDLARGRRFLDSKLWGPLRLVRAAHAQVRRSIALFSGAASRKIAPGGALTTTINAAVEALARALALELAPLRVNVISPGIVDTPVWDTLLAPDERRALFAALPARLPARRAGAPDELAAATLAVLENPYMTGAVVLVDGGYALT